jgi:hypothetical protein
MLTLNGKPKRDSQTPGNSSGIQLSGFPLKKILIADSQRTLPTTPWRAEKAI